MTAAPLRRLLYSQAEAAQMLDVSVKTLLAQVRAGHLRYVLIGRRKKFAPEDLRNWRRKRDLSKQPAAPDPTVYAPDKRDWQRVLWRAKWGARTRGFKFDLTRQDLDDMIERAAGACEVSGLPFSMARVDGAAPFGPSIDRIDCKTGYTRVNCRLVCFIVNVAMNLWGEEALYRMAAALVERRKT